jgi:hypothetical protein
MDQLKNKLEINFFLRSALHDEGQVHGVLGYVGG